MLGGGARRQNCSARLSLSSRDETWEDRAQNGGCVRRSSARRRSRRSRKTGRIHLRHRCGRRPQVEVSPGRGFAWHSVQAACQYVPIPAPGPESAKNSVEADLGSPTTVLQMIIRPQRSTRSTARLRPSTSRVAGGAASVWTYCRMISGARGSDDLRATTRGRFERAVQRGGGI